MLSKYFSDCKSCTHLKHHRDDKPRDDELDFILLIDSHAHLDSDRYGAELPEILRRAKLAGVDAILAIGIGEGPAEMYHALDICRQFNAPAPKGSVGSAGEGLPRLYASAGIYPHNAHEADDAALAKLNSLLAEPEVIACGEIGLDYYHQGSPHETQKAIFIRQMEIAAARKRPILIHCRPKDGDNTCWDDCLHLIEKHWAPTGIGFLATPCAASRSFGMS